MSEACQIVGNPRQPSAVVKCRAGSRCIVGPLPLDVGTATSGGIGRSAASSTNKVQAFYCSDVIETATSVITAAAELQFKATTKATTTTSTLTSKKIDDEVEPKNNSTANKQKDHQNDKADNREYIRPSQGQTSGYGQGQTPGQDEDQTSGQGRYPQSVAVETTTWNNARVTSPLASNQGQTSGQNQRNVTDTTDVDSPVVTSQRTPTIAKPNAGVQNQANTDVGNPAEKRRGAFGSDARVPGTVPGR